MVDVNLLESMLQMMSALPSAAAHLDYEQPRLGSGIPYSVPRHVPVRRRQVDRDLDVGRIGRAPLTLLGVAHDPRFETFESRAGHREELDAIVGEWVGAVECRSAGRVRRGGGRDRARVLDARPAGRSARDRARVRRGRRRRDARIRSRALRTPGEVRFVGRSLGADTDAVLDEL